MISNKGVVYQMGTGTGRPGGEFLKNPASSQLDELAKKAEKVIFQTRSLRPLFSRFRDEITICTNRITIIRGGWLGLEEYPMNIESVTGARVFHGYMFSTLEVDTFGVAKPPTLKHLRTSEARLARRYILALIECKKANVDLTGLEINELQEKLKNIGMVRFSPYSRGYHDL